jgi:hypothetical protein
VKAETTTAVTAESISDPSPDSFNFSHTQATGASPWLSSFHNPIFEFPHNFA